MGPILIRSDVRASQAVDELRFEYMGSVLHERKYVRVGSKWGGMCSSLGKWKQMRKKPESSTLAGRSG